MSSIKFSYEVVSVDNATHEMTVKYSADNYPSMNIRIPFPVAPDTVDDQCIAAAPTYEWKRLAGQLDIPTVGAKGVSGTEDKVLIKLTPI